MTVKPYSLEEVLDRATKFDFGPVTQNDFVSLYDNSMKVYAQNNPHPLSVSQADHNKWVDEQHQYAYKTTIHFMYRMIDEEQKK